MRASIQALLSLFLLIAAPAPALTPAEHREDLQTVLRELPARHPNPFFKTPEADFRAAAAQLDRDIPELTAEQFYVRLMKLIAMLGDGHTSLRLPPASGFAALAETFPVEFRWFADGIFVTAAPENQRWMNGAKLLAVGGLPVEDVAARLNEVVSHENDYFLRAAAPDYLRKAGVLRGLGLAPGTGPAAFSLRLADGTERTVSLPPSNQTRTPAINGDEGYLPQWLRRPADLYWSEYWPQHRAVYFRYRACQEMPSRPFATFAAQTLALTLGNEVDSFLVDVRGNGGGNSDVVTPLLMGLAQSIDTLKTRNPRFQVFLLADGGTYSSGTFVVWQTILSSFPPDVGAQLPPGVKPLAATYVGEPTGGKPEHYGDVRMFTLPRSGLAVSHSTRLWELVPGIPDRDAYYPDVPVAVYSTDYFARHDPILAAALTRALGPPPGPAGEVVVVNSASFRRDHGIAPGSFASALGVFPAGARLTVNGAEAAVAASSPSQIVFMVPPQTLPGPATVEVRQGQTVAARGQFQVVAAGPGLFVTNLLDPGQPGAVLNQNSLLNTKDRPAARGSVVQIFGTGYGPLDPGGRAAAEVWMADYPAEVLFSGPAPGVPGLWQINARVPDLPGLKRQTPLFVKAHDRLSNGVTVWVEVE